MKPVVLSKRKKLRFSLLVTLTYLLGFTYGQQPLLPDRTGGVKTKISLNAYSFNTPLRNGSMTVDDMLDFCATQGIEGIDLTGYYLPGYPNVPSDEYLYHIKRKAFLLGIDISGTGIRTDFSTPDKAKREADIALVKNWIVAASKLGAPVIRVFSGTSVPEGYTWEQTASWIADDLRTCAEFGKQHGVIVAVQNHNDFLKTADETIKLIQQVNHEWFGLILDIGSFRSGDPYTQIEKILPYAVNWQIKEKVWMNNTETDADLIRLKTIIQKSAYRGYLPIETLGEGNPKEKLSRFLPEVRKYLEFAPASL